MVVIWIYFVYTFVPQQGQNGRYSGAWSSAVRFQS